VEYDVWNLPTGVTHAHRVPVILLLGSLCASTLAQAQSLPATGGFVELATSTAVRTPLSASDAAAILPARGLFTFPAPYNTTAFRLTNATDCGGADCVKPVGYSYWNRINNHVGSETMLIFLTLNRNRGGAGPTLFSVNKRTGETRNLGPLFPATSSLSWETGEGWYFSRTRPYTLYLNQGPRLLRYDVNTRTLTTVFDVTGQFGSNRYIWQVHSSNDDRVHSATLRASATYAMLGCVVYREDVQQWYYAAAAGDFDECQVDKSGRWLVIKENVDGRNGEDNRIIDLQAGSERVLLDENGAGGHSDQGFGTMVAADNYSPTPGAVRAWRFELDVQGGEPVATVAGQGTLVYRLTSWNASVGHIAFGNARADLPLDQQIACNSSATRQLLPRVNEIVCYRLDGSLQTLVVAPNLVNLDAAGGGSDDYSKMPKGNLDVTGDYFVWTANAGSGRLDAYVVRVPAGLLNGAAPAPAFEGVQWTDLVNVTVSGTVLQKTGGCSGCFDAGAASLQQFTSGDAVLRFSASEITTARLIGLSAANMSTGPRELLFAFQLSSGVTEVRESGRRKARTPFVPGDVFEIQIRVGAVHYVKNGVVFYTSQGTAQYPLQVDTSMVTVGATLRDVQIRR
jgi:hypothetical protein